MKRYLAIAELGLALARGEAKAHADHWVMFSYRTRASNEEERFLQIPSENRHHM